MSEIIEYAQSLATRGDRRELITDLEAMMQTEIDTGTLEVAEDNLNEIFCNGMYSREITLSSGTVAVGEIHKQDHINILSKGTVLVFTEDGIQEIVAPHRWVGTAGTKRATFVKEDAVWTTFHATEHTTSEKVREDFVAKSFDDIKKVTVQNGMDNSGSGRGVNSR